VPPAQTPCLRLRHRISGSDTVFVSKTPRLWLRHRVCGSDTVSVAQSPYWYRHRLGSDTVLTPTPCLTLRHRVSMSVIGGTSNFYLFTMGYGCDIMKKTNINRYSICHIICHERPCRLACNPLNKDLHAVSKCGKILLGCLSEPKIWHSKNFGYFTVCFTDGGR
jgi:hypothetical protein